MTTHIPTIQELERKGVRELHTIFRNAAEFSANSTRAEAERAAAGRRWTKSAASSGVATIGHEPGILRIQSAPGWSMGDARERVKSQPLPDGGPESAESSPGRNSTWTRLIRVSGLEGPDW